MKKLLLSIVCLQLVSMLFAQSRFTVVQFNKMDVPGIICEVPFIETTVRAAIDKNFEKLGYKGRKQKDYMVYAGVTMPEFGNETYDIYVLVERKSRQEKDVSNVTFLMSKGFEHFVGEREENRLLDKTKTYMNGLKNLSAAYDLELQIAEQEEAMKKAIKKLDNLKEDSVALIKKKRKIEDDMAQNRLNISSQKTDSTRQRQILDVLKSKRKTGEMKEEKMDY
ncbi:MAG: hypothetical protein KGZ59_00630 [Chitinophagaceae bacterium]|nr:hypothetical protein [Chitinophagaceae bacterium]